MSHFYSCYYIKKNNKKNRSTFTKEYLNTVWTMGLMSTFISYSQMYFNEITEKIMYLSILGSFLTCPNMQTTE